MNEYGLALKQLIERSAAVEEFDGAIEVSASKRVAVFLPSKVLSEDDPFEPSWSVTSDSIAAYIAHKLKSKKLILATDVDGIFSKNPRTDPHAQLLTTVSLEQLLELDVRTSVDKFLPKFLVKNGMECYVVNGKYPERLGRILSGEQTICTRICPKRAHPQ